MIVDTLIEKEFFSLSSTLTFKEAYKIFKKSKLNELPIVDDSIFKGILFVDQIKGNEKSDDPVSLLQDQFRSIFVEEDERMIVALKKMTNEGISSIPVIDDEGNMLGLVLSSHLWSEFAEKSGLMGTGAWIVVSMKKNDYHLSEIAQIAESSGMIIVMHFVHFFQGVDLIDVHLKFDHENVIGLVQSLQRYKYNVTDVIQPKKYSDNWEDKFDELMRFFST